MSNTGYKYIYKARTKKVGYQVRIPSGLKSERIGTFNTLEEAIARRTEMMKENGIKLYLDK